jgi:hypothetical protein
VGLLDKFNKDLDSGIEAFYSKELESYRTMFNKVQSQALEKCKTGVPFWRRLHYGAASSSIISSLGSLILTFSDHQGWIIALSITSALSITVIIVFNPSKRQAELKQLKQLCESIDQDFIFTEQDLKKKPDLYKQAILTRLANEIKNLSQKVNNF